MSNYIPLYVFLGCLFTVGVILPFFIGSFIDVNIPSSESVITPFATLINDGLSFSIFGLGTIDLNFFFFLPQVARDYISNYVNTFTYIPNYLAVPLIVVMVTSLAYTVIKLFWGS